MPIEKKICIIEIEIKSVKIQRKWRSVSIVASETFEC